jgi:ribonuclease R
MEITATEAERASGKFMQAKYMKEKTGQEFEGIISGLTDWGIFVELTENKCEGMIRMRDLDDDFYEFDESNFRLKGNRTGKIYRLGDHIRIRVKSADLMKKQIDFVPAGAKDKPAEQRRSSRGTEQRKKQHTKRKHSR